MDQKSWTVHSATPQLEEVEEVRFLNQVEVFVPQLRLLRGFVRPSLVWRVEPKTRFSRLKTKNWDSLSPFTKPFLVLWQWDIATVDRTMGTPTTFVLYKISNILEEHWSNVTSCVARKWFRCRSWLAWSKQQRNFHHPISTFASTQEGGIVTPLYYISAMLCWYLLFGNDKDWDLNGKPIVKAWPQENLSFYSNESSVNNNK
jgi:hypothetical protein